MIPPQADLGGLAGLEAGFKYPNVTIDGGEFVGAKAYKDAKVCNMLTVREMDRRFAKSTGITFSTLYPGCIAETALFRNHVKPFQVRPCASCLLYTNSSAACGVETRLQAVCL